MFLEKFYFDKSRRLQAFIAQFAYYLVTFNELVCVFVPFDSSSTV